jgi:excisionase family DNA binding protein
MAAPPDLAALLADPARVADVPAAEVQKLILQCSAEHHRLAALETALASRLAPGEREGTPIGDALTNGTRGSEQPATAPPSEQGQLTQEEAAKAYKMPLRTVRRLTRTGRIPTTWIGRSRMVRPADFDRYLARCRAQGVKVGTLLDV